MSKQTLATMPQCAAPTSVHVVWLVIEDVIVTLDPAENVVSRMSWLCHDVKEREDSDAAVTSIIKARVIEV